MPAKTTHRAPALISAPVLMSLVAWMLSGSPVPLALSCLLCGAAFAGGRFPWSENGRFLFLSALVSGALAAAIWQARLFRSGEAFAFRADPPATLHLAFALLWIAAVLHLGSGSSRSGRRAARPLVFTAAFTGLFFGLWGALQCDRYDFAAWQFLPLAFLAWLLLASPFLVRRAPSTGRGWRGALYLGSAACLLAGAALLLETATLRAGTLLRGNSGPGIADESPAPAPAALDRGQVDGGSRRLARKADLRFDDRIRLYLKTDSGELFDSWIAEPLYLRASTLSVFEGEEVLSPLRVGRWFFAGGEDPEEQELSTGIVLPAARSQEGQVYDYSLYIERESADAVPLLPGTTHVRVDALHEFGDDWFQIVPEHGVERLRYSATAPVRRVALEDDGAFLRHGGAPDSYLELPQTPLRTRLESQLATEARERPLAALSAFFRERTRYSLSYEADEGMGALESFLFGDGVGHCELYAAAAVMKLRALGIPSRVAYGFTGGLVDAEERAIAFRDRDFHAWAEILTPSLEWAVFDATTAVPGAVGYRPEPFALGATEWESYRDYSPGRFEAAARSEWERALAEGIAWLSRRFPYLFGGVLALLWIAGRGRSSGDAAAPGPPGEAAEREGRSLPAYLAELAAIGEGRGVFRGPGETWAEYLDRLAAGAPVPEEVHEALRYHYRVRYAGAAREASSERGHELALRRWGKRSLSH